MAAISDRLAPARPRFDWASTPTGVGLSRLAPPSLQSRSRGLQESRATGSAAADRVADPARRTRPRPRAVRGRPRVARRRAQRARARAGAPAGASEAGGQIDCPRTWPRRRRIATSSSPGKRATALAPGSPRSSARSACSCTSRSSRSASATCPDASGLQTLMRAAQPGQRRRAAVAADPVLGVPRRKDTCCCCAPSAGCSGSSGSPGRSASSRVATRARVPNFRRVSCYVPIIGGVVTGVGVLLSQIGEPRGQRIPRRPAHGQGGRARTGAG